MILTTDMNVRIAMFVLSALMDEVALQHTIDSIKDGDPGGFQCGVRILDARFLTESVDILIEEPIFRNRLNKPLNYRTHVNMASNALFTRDYNTESVSLMGDLRIDFTLDASIWEFMYENIFGFNYYTMAEPIQMWADYLYNNTDDVMIEDDEFEEDGDAENDLEEEDLEDDNETVISDEILDDEE